MLICLIILLLTLVCRNQTVIVGARYGLMLWYHDVLPLLLPFMIIANLFVLHIRNRQKPNHHAICILFLLGLLCGYPLGAKIGSDFSKEHILSPRITTILLPMCNNVSPMFLSGYIGHFVLNDAYSFPFIVAMLYIPYLFVTCISLGIYRIREKKSNANNLQQKKEEPQRGLRRHSASYSHAINTGKETEHAAPDTILLQSIIQITYVGLYIMLCSILVSLVSSISAIPTNTATIFGGILEITQGTKTLAVSSFSDHIKTALILACTSFGGISAILQTCQVTQKSGLSMPYYILIKILCACMTGCLTYLLII